MFWSFGGMQRKIKESANVATGVADGHERGVGVNPETHVTGDVPNDGVGECGDKIKIFFRCGKGFFGRLCLVGSDLYEGR